MKTKSLKIGIIISLIIVSTLNEKQIAPKNLPTFQQFKQRFKKQYATEQQQNYRRSVYNKNKKDILQNTQCKDCGVNVFSDKTTDQRKSQLFGLSLPANFEQIISQSQHKVKAKLKLNAASFPASLDWRQKKAVTKVRNQGSCGACWAFQMTGAAQSLLIIQGKGNVNTLDLSQQGLLQCTTGSSCSGGHPDYAAQLIITGGGMYNESKYPYKPNQFYKGNICDASIKKDFQSPATSSSNYYGSTDSQIIQLLQTSPIGVTIDADSLSSKYDPTQNPVHKCSISDNQINHGVLLVGYTPTYWIIKNSWGTKWGIDGFAYISRNRLNNQNCVIHTWITVLESTCNIANCDKCITSNSCSVCSSGFYLYKNGTDNACKPCLDKNCQTCYTKQQNPALQGRCKFCKTGFSLQAKTQTCKNAMQINIDHCLVHSGDFSACITCDDSYVINSDATKCLKCQVSNCQQCLYGNTDRCRTCKPGYSGEKCDMMCSDKCQGGCTSPGMCRKCQNGYKGKNCQIIQCLDNCQKCSKPFTCDQCQQGYSLPNCDPLERNSIKCNPLVQNCAKGCSKDPNICDECNQNYYGNHCNIQQVCESGKCRTTLTTIDQKDIKKQNSGLSLQNIKTKVQQTLNDVVSVDYSNRQTGLTIGLIVVCILFVFTLVFVAFLIYRLRNIKRINIIQPLQSEGSNKSIPYVGKRIAV